MKFKLIAIAKSFRAALALLAVVVWLAPSTAAADRLNVVVLPFEGGNNAALEKDVRTAIAKKHAVLSAKTWTQAAKAEGLTRLSAKNIRKVARTIGADAVVLGETETKRGKIILMIKVREGNSGEVVNEDDIEVKLSARKFDAKSKKAVTAAVLEALGNVTKGAAADDTGGFSGAAKPDDPGTPDKGRQGSATGDEPDEKPDEKRGEEPVDKPKNAKPTATKQKPDPADSDEPSDRTDKKAQATSQPSPLPNARRGSLQLGAGAASRTLSFNAEAGLTPPPQGYEGGFAPILLANAIVYPMALVGDGQGFLRNLGISLVYQRVLFLQTDVGGATIGTTQQRLGAGLHYRMPLGSASLQAGVRYTMLTFELDKSAAPAGTDIPVPNVDYTLLEPTLTVEYPLSKSFYLGLTGRFLAALDSGEFDEPAWYGVSTVTAAEFELHADYMLTKSIMTRLTGSFATIGYKIKGTGSRSKNADDDAAQDVFGASDTYITVGLQAGYVF